MVIGITGLFAVRVVEKHDAKPPEPLHAVTFDDGARMGDGYELRLDEIEIREDAGGPPSIHALPVVESSEYSIGNGFKPNIVGTVIGVRDESGNLDPFNIHETKAPGGVFQRQSRRLELLYQVERNQSPFPASTTKRLKEASALRGQSVATFILEVVSREADRVLEEKKVWNMSVEAAENIQRMLVKPPSVNGAAKKAAKDIATHVRIRS